MAYDLARRYCEHCGQTITFPCVEGVRVRCLTCGIRYRSVLAPRFGDAPGTPSAWYLADDSPLPMHDTEGVGVTMATGKVDAERLAEIRARLSWRDGGTAGTASAAGASGMPLQAAFLLWLTTADTDMVDLLAFAEAALPIVQTVAGIQEWAGDPHTPYDARISLLTITRARALLASETPEGGAGRDDGQA